MTVEEIRVKINDTDDAIAALLQERFLLTDTIGQIKKTQGLPVKNAGREAEVLARVTAGAPESMREDIRMIYERIMERSRARQTEVSG